MEDLATSLSLHQQQETSCMEICFGSTQHSLDNEWIMGRVSVLLSEPMNLKECKTLNIQLDTVRKEVYT